ncbi:heat shock factor-binding protein 1-like protein 1 [Pantherophis guttatus]|uniref:Heat shock factor-binding protein 1-like protein 1 n=2 Tax=Colubrinae TaxID=169863 RepID=A0A6P9CZF9_PANGU|nr:heat shock factor-binding protein 1-like protein 1 [Pantherophis guttatus]
MTRRARGMEEWKSPRRFSHWFLPSAGDRSRVTAPTKRKPTWSARRAAGRRFYLRSRFPPVRGGNWSRKDRANKAAAAVSQVEKEGMADNDPPSAKELSHFAENLLQQLQENFEDLTDKLSLQMDEMGERINDLEKHVAELMAEAGIENTSEDSERTEGIKETLHAT